MIAILLGFLFPTAVADTVQVQLEVSNGEFQLIDAVLSPSFFTQTQELNNHELGTLRAVAEDGTTLATAPLYDPRPRSIINTNTGGESIRLIQAGLRIQLEWPEGATRVQLNTNSIIPRQRMQMSDDTDLVAVNLSGDANERLNMVFLGDGYTDIELPQFASDVDRIANYMFSSIEPYGTYETAFNIWRIDRASNESGVSHTEYEPHTVRDTVYGCFYGCAGIDRLICCDDGDVINEVNSLLPEADGIMVLINDPTYGGSGGFTYATSFTAGTSGEMVASHELGHSLIGLWDEYDYGIDGGGGGGPNCSNNEGGEGWAHWLEESDVDAFATCSYRDLYRPTQNGCMMNSLQGNYCPICIEETVRTIYRHLPSLIGTVSEPEGVLIVESDGLELSANPALPSIESLSWDWTLDDVQIGIEPTIRLEPCGQSGTLVLTLSDETIYVRDDPYDLLSDHLTWEIERPVCIPTDDTGAGDTVDSGRFMDENRCGCTSRNAFAAFVLFLPLSLRRRNHSGSR